MNPFAHLTINTVTVTGIITYMKETNNRKVVFGVRQKTGKVYCMYQCAVPSNMLEEVSSKYKKGDHVLVSGALGNWAVSTCTFKHVIINVLYMTLLMPEEVAPKKESAYE